MADLLEIARQAQQQTGNPTTNRSGGSKGSKRHVGLGESPSSNDYTDRDLAEMDRLIRELAQLEGWENDELEQMLDERRRMAPCNVRKALAALRIATREALAPWPNRPAKRARVTLCEMVSKRRELVVLDGGAE
jgi:hypothetical protein